jgi:hypothetical protein
MSGFQLYPMALRNAEGEVKIVRNSAEEKDLLDQGYERPGTSNPAAFTAQAGGHTIQPRAEWPKYIDGKVVQDPSLPPPTPKGSYPRWVNGKIVQDPSLKPPGEYPKWRDGQVVENEEEDIAALMDADEEMRVPAFERSQERDRLLSEAGKLGLHVDGRWGLTRLREVVGVRKPAAGE